MAVIRVLGAGGDRVPAWASLAAGLHQQTTLYRWHRENVPYIGHGFLHLAGHWCRALSCWSGADLLVCASFVFFWSGWHFPGADRSVCSADSGSALLNCREVNNAKHPAVSATNGGVLLAVTGALSSAAGLPYHGGLCTGKALIVAFDTLQQRFYRPSGVRLRL